MGSTASSKRRNRKARHAQNHQKTSATQTPTFWRRATTILVKPLTWFVEVVVVLFLILARPLKWLTGICSAASFSWANQLYNRADLASYDTFGGEGYRMAGDEHMRLAIIFAVACLVFWIISAATDP